VTDSRGCSLIVNTAADTEDAVTSVPRIVPARYSMFWSKMQTALPSHHLASPLWRVCWAHTVCSTAVNESETQIKFKREESKKHEGETQTPVAPPPPPPPAL